MTQRFRDLVEPSRPKKTRSRFRLGALLTGLERQSQNWGQRTRFPSDAETGSEEPAREERPAHDKPAVMAELNLTEDLTKEELLRLRRRFAKANHPDAHPRYRSDYEQRMKLANQIIDDRIRSLTRGSSEAD